MEKKSFFKNFLTIGAGMIIYMIVGIIGTPIITRLVDPVDYGRMSILTTYSNIGLMLCGLGLDQALLRFFYRDEGGLPAKAAPYLHRHSADCCGGCGNCGDWRLWPGLPVDDDDGIDPSGVQSAGTGAESVYPLAAAAELPHEALFYSEYHPKKRLHSAVRCDGDSDRLVSFRDSGGGYVSQHPALRRYSRFCDSGCLAFAEAGLSFPNQNPGAFALWLPHHAGRQYQCGVQCTG